jgi:hypothetical protein
MNNFFEKIAEKESGEYYFNNEIVSSGIGSRTPYNIHLLDIVFKNQKIQIKNEIGLGNIGSVSCKLPLNSGLYDFSIRTRSHFFKLFVKDKKSFIIKCNNEKFKKTISENLSIKKLQGYTLNTQFELMIYCKINENSHEIITEYNIIYENRENVLIELIQFYKYLINEL